MSLVDDLTGGLAWKAGAVVGAVASLSLGAGLIHETMRGHDLAKQVQTYTLAINDPHTGYVARLAQSETNVTSLRTQVQGQNAALAQESATSKAIIADLEQKVDVANRAAALADAQVTSMLAQPLVGATLCERYDAADALVLGTLQ